MLQRFARERGTKPTTYYYAIARNCAKDEIRKQRFVELDSKSETEIRDEHDMFAMMEKKDEQRIVLEAFERLAMDCRDKQKVQILLRYVVNGEERTRLAEELGVTDDFVSLVKSRWRPCLQKLIRLVIQEDRDGKLNFHKNDLRYLKPYMMNW